MRWKKAALENCLGVPCVVTPPAPSFTCGTSTISDYDGNVYNTVSIVTQCWTTTNLKVTKYNDGTNIPEIPGSGTWNNTIVTGARTVYEVSGTPVSGYVGNYGYLYNWYAFTNSRKLCPEGWHGPTDAEWTNLIRIYEPGASASVDGDQSLSAGTVLKSSLTNTTAGVGLGWDPASSSSGPAIPSPGTNTSGFSALPGGDRGTNGVFNDLRLKAKFWSATELDNYGAWYRNLYNFAGSVFRSFTDKKEGASVRCLKN